LAPSRWWRWWCRSPKWRTGFWSEHREGPQRARAGPRGDPARGGAGGPGRPPEREYATEFEEPALLTLGLCYQKNSRFSGGAYHPVLKRTEKIRRRQAQHVTGGQTSPGRAAGGAGCGGGGGGDAAQGAGPRESLPQGVRAGADQSDQVPQGRAARSGRGDWKDAGRPRRFDAGKVKADRWPGRGGAPPDEG
jgi:hypothetical protein